MPQTSQGRRMFFNDRESTEIEKLQTEAQKLGAEKRKLLAEEAKLKRETFFYPLVAGSAVLTAFASAFAFFLKL
jgi:hypothetical protein